MQYYPPQCGGGAVEERGGARCRLVIGRDAGEEVLTLPTSTPYWLPSTHYWPASTHNWSTSIHRLTAHYWPTWTHYWPTSIHQHTSGQHWHTTDKHQQTTDQHWHTLNWQHTIDWNRHTIDQDQHTTDQSIFTDCVKNRLKSWFKKLEPQHLISRFCIPFSHRPRSYKLNRDFLKSYCSKILSSKNLRKMPTIK